jgi:prepilin-type N-terminal cleavage/methylation domain-containing protein
MSPIRRRGLTLLELVVVMVILVALAGILVPLLPGMLGRARTAEQSTNAIELMKAWQIYRATNSEQHYPDGLDSLVDQDGAVYARLPGVSITDLFTVCDFSELATAVSLNSTTVDAATLVDRVRNLGIQNVYTMNSLTTNATFEPYGTGVTTPTAVSVAADTKLVRLSSDVAVAKLNAPTDGVCVVLGVGQRSTIVGYGGIASAPIHAGDEPGTSPMERYSRYGVVFNLKPTTPQFIGVVAFHTDGIATSDDAMQDYYRLQTR